MSGNRLWRPAAQRSVRNAWGYIQAQLSAWSTASATARGAATSLVNAYLSERDLGAMDLGVLRDVDGIRDHARIKLRAQQEIYLQKFLESYDALVHSVFEMRSTSASMRTYAKDSGGGPLIEFTKNPTVDGDTGDGGGISVFAVLPLQAFEELAKDLVTMFQKELKVKWLLASEFHNLVYQGTEAKNSKQKGLHFPNFDLLIDTHKGESNECDEGDEARSAIPNIQRNLQSRETLQVYLTALLAEVHINKYRIDEVSRLWSEEMTTGFIGSPRG